MYPLRLIQTVETRPSSPQPPRPAAPLWLIRKQRTRTSNIWLAPATGHGRASTAADKQKTVSSTDLVKPRISCPGIGSFIGCWASDLRSGRAQVNISVFVQSSKLPILILYHLLGIPWSIQFIHQSSNFQQPDIKIKFSKQFDSSCFQLHASSYVTKCLEKLYNSLDCERT